MVSLNYSKIISYITDGLVSYISNLEDLKYQYEQSLKEYQKLNDLYENMNYNLNAFVKEYAKSSKSKREYFISIVNEVYDDKDLAKKLFNETRNNYLVSIYSNNDHYPMLNDFMDKLKERIDSLSLMLNEDKIKEIDSKINEYIDFSDIFDKDKLLGLYDVSKYIDIIDSLDIDSDIKIQAMEMGIEEFNRLYDEKLEEEFSSYNELSLDLDEELDKECIDQFNLDEVENE